jgi:hypothetical protein
MKMPKRTGKARVEKRNQAYNLKKSHPGTRQAFYQSPITHTKCIDPTGGNGRFAHRSHTWTGDISSIQLLGHTRSTYFSKSATKQSLGRLNMIHGIATRYWERGVCKHVRTLHERGCSGKGKTTHRAKFDRFSLATPLPKRFGDAVFG